MSALSEARPVAGPLAQWLGRAMRHRRGLALKVGQLLAFSDHPAFEALPYEARPMPVGRVLSAIEGALDAPWSQRFAEVEEAGVAASFSQVHAARLHDGRRVALKVQLPEARRQLERDLTWLRRLLHAGPARRWGFDVAAYEAFLRDRLLAELDYTQERAAQEAAAAFAPPGLVVPETLGALCRPGLLVQAWEEGAPLEEAAAWPLAERQALGLALLRFTLAGLFRHGRVHADPHPGNFRFRRGPAGPEVVVYDFGCTAALSAESGRIWLAGLLAARERRDVDPVALLAGLGFDPERLEPARHALPTLLEVLWEPFLTRGPFDLSCWRLSERVEGRLGAHKWTFRTAAPASVLYMVRTLFGVVSLLARLDARLDWFETLKESAPEALAEAARLPLPVAAPRSASFAHLAERLRVRITEGGRAVVDLTLPAHTLDDLPSLLGGDLLSRVAEQGYDEAAIRARLAEQGRTRGELFSFSLAPREYRLWLE